MEYCDFSAVATRATQEQVLSVVLKYRCRILITSRCRFENLAELPVGELEDPQELLRLMECFYTGAGEKRGCMEALIQVVHGHTFAVELIARLLEQGILEPEELYEKLRREAGGNSAQACPGWDPSGQKNFGKSVTTRPRQLVRLPGPCCVLWVKGWAANGQCFVADDDVRW